MNTKSTQKRIIALVFLVCFFIVSILSGAFILTHTEHNHDHDGVNGCCATCAQLQCTESILKLLGIALVGALFAIAGLYALISAIKVITIYIELPTPVNQKFRMNN